MKGIELRKILCILLTVLFLGGSLTLMNRKSHAESLKDLKAGLPDRVTAWKAVEGADRFYDRETIFDYIDGAGEVYRAYNMQGCLSRRYTAAKGGPSIILDFFDMGSPADAFGVFTHDLDGEALDIGQGALYRPGWLSFWKDRFFVSIYADMETSAAEEAVKALGRAASGLIGKQGPEPGILQKLPREGLEKKVRYFHHHTILNYHYYLSDENILHLNAETEAVLAPYAIKGQRGLLLLVLYPEEVKAALARSSFLKHYIPEARSGSAVFLEDGKWAAAGVKGRLLTVVLEAETRELAERLLDKVGKDTD